MKTSTALLIGSLAANGVILSALALRPAATLVFLRDTFARRAESSVTAKPASPPPKPASALEPPGEVPAPLRDIDWTKLQVADYAAIGAHLTSLGFPPQAVRSFTAMLIHQHYSERRRALQSRPDPAEYWRNSNPRPSPENLSAYRELDRERNKTLRAVVGLDFDFEDDANAQRRRYGNLPADKITQLNRILSDYSDLEEQMFADNVDRNSAESRARSALLAKEKRADIERLFTADELLDYDLRNSPAAHQLRNKLGMFQATETEFRALFPAFHTAMTQAEQASSGRGNFADTRQARESAERGLNDELRRVLGEARYTELQEANDHALQQTRELVASLNLSPAVLKDVVSIQNNFQPRLSAVERDRDLTPNQRDAQLGALAIDARNQLTRLLGPDGFEAYKRRGGGWLGLGLSRAAPSPPPSP